MTPFLSHSDPRTYDIIPNEACPFSVAALRILKHENPEEFQESIQTLEPGMIDAVNQITLDFAYALVERYRKDLERSMTKTVEIRVGES